MTVLSSLARAWRRLLTALPWLLLVVLTALLLLHTARLGINDDAYITFRVARNLAEGAGPVFNPGERVLSVTTPGYMLLLAASSLFSADFVRLALIWNVAALLALGALLIAAARSEAQSPLAATLAALVVVALGFSNPLLAAAMGMETVLYLALMAAALAAYSRALHAGPRTSRWLMIAAAAAALAFVVRPDGALVGLVLGGHWLLTRRKVPWAALLVAALMALPWLLFAWSYYGSPVPNTLAAKVTQGQPDPATRWGQQLWQTALVWTEANPLAALAALIGLGVLLYRLKQQRSAAVQARGLLLLWAALYIGLHGLLGVRGYFWYYVPLLPVVALLAGDGVAWLWQRLGPGRPQIEDARPTAALQPVLVLLFIATLFLPVIKETAVLARLPETPQRETVYGNTGLLLRSLCAEADNPSVGMAEIGLLGYLSGCRVVDFSGLLQPEIARLQLPPAEKMAWVVQAYDPRVVVFAGSDLYPDEVADQLWYRQRYEPYDIQDERGFRSVTYQQALGVETRRTLPAVWWQVTPAAAQPVSATLYFSPTVVPSITLHVFLPDASGLTVTANGAPVVQVKGAAATWQDVPVPVTAAADGRVSLLLHGWAGDQAAALAWIDSNAIPVTRYMAAFREAAMQPRPAVELQAGDRVRLTLAPPVNSPLALDIGFRDLPGTQIEAWVNGELLGTVGAGSGPRQVTRLLLPHRLTAPATVELRNTADFARIFYAALVDANQPAYRP